MALFRFKEFIIEKFTETSKNTPFLYKDENLTIKVVKTADAAKEQGKDTNWCSNSSGSFYDHNMTSNMYRFIFNDGYKLRLTWDYITQYASLLGSFSGGTHWGQGGKVNGERLNYDVLRPEDESEPFYIDYKSKNKREIVERILSIPDEAQKLVHEYQKKASIEKTAILNSLYKEIMKVKIKDVVENKTQFEIIVTYNNEEIKLLMYNKFIYVGRLADKFKNKYGAINSCNGGALQNYVYDKTMEFCKKNNKKDILEKIRKSE